MSDQIEFSEKYLTGVRQIDREHRKLFAIAGQVQSALAAIDPETAVRAAIGELIEYTRTHFASEESLMESYRYPELDSHRQLHADLLGHVQDMELRLDVGDPSTAIDLSRFLAEWLINHIQGIDKRFGAFVAEHGGDQPA